MQGVGQDRSVAQAPGLGARLRARREAMGLGLGAVHAATRVPRRLIQAIEAGEFTRLRAHVYAAAAVRRYARLLGLDPGPLLAALDAETQGLWLREEAPMPPPPERRRCSFWGRRGRISLFY
jgi:cytoskeleton protein RodZ